MLGKLPHGVTRLGNRFRARMSINGRVETIGIYGTPELAAQALSHARSLTSGTRKQTLAEWGDKWFEHRESSGLYSHTYKEQSVWRTHVLGTRLCDLELGRIKRTDVVRWVRALAAKDSVRGNRLSRQTIVHALKLVKTSLQYAADEGRVRSNVAADVKPPREARRTDPTWTFLTLDEVSKLSSADVYPQYRIVWTIAVYTGLRKGELRMLRWADVHLGSRPMIVVRGSKTRSSNRQVPLLPAAESAIREWRRMQPGTGAALVFPGKWGKPHHPSWDAGWKRHAHRVLGRRVRFHDLRHTCASLLVSGQLGGALSLMQVRDWLGHSEISVTQRYAHLGPDSLHAWADSVRKTTRGEST